MPISLIKRLIPSASLLEDAEKTVMWNLLCRACKRKESDGTILGCLPCSIGKDQLGSLHEGPYLASLKADGVRFFLFLSTRPGMPTSPIALLVDRSRNMYEIHVSAPRPYFEKTSVFEGELVWKQPEQHEMLFLFFDCLLSQGVFFSNRPFSERLREIKRCLSNTDAREADSSETEVYCEHITPKIKFLAKQFVDFRFVKQLWENRINTCYYVDGIVFVHAEDTYVHGRAKLRMLKWKEKPTVDLWCKEDGWVDANRYVELQRSVKDKRICIEKNSLFAPGDLVEFYVRLKEDVIYLTPCRKREDKSNANSASVVLMTLCDVLANIVIEDFIAVDLDLEDAAP